MDGIKNPDRIQCRPFGRQSKSAPVVLIHDGGGTTFAYYMLEELDRDVYTIYDPKYTTAESWKGGMDEMAAHYLRLITEAVPRGPVILGGWSLGGYIALAVARLIADNSNSPISVAGFLLVDTPYHIPRAQFPEDCVEPDHSDLPLLTQKAFDRCDDMLDTWELPTWDSAPCETYAVDYPQRGRSKDAKYPSSIPPGHFVRESVHGEVAVEQVVVRSDSRASSRSASPTPSDGSFSDYGSRASSRSSSPNSSVGSFKVRGSRERQAELAPAVLIRCAKRCIEHDSRGRGAQVDYFRDDALLGWASSRYPEFIKLAIDVDAHHYNLFDLDRVDTTTRVMKQGLDALDELRLSDRWY